MNFPRNGLALVLLFWSGLTQAGPSPVIYSISPQSGPPGTQVTITGNNLYCVDTVFFSTDTTATAAFKFVSSTQIIATVPGNAVTAPVAVYSSAFQSSATSSSIFYVAPTISNFSPRNGVVGTQVTLDGSGFDDPFQSTRVYFNGIQALSGEVTSDSQITAFVPVGATTGYITITNSSGSARSIGYFYLNPVVNQFTGRAATGATIDVYGTSLLGVSRVALAGETLSFKVITGTNLQAVIPPDAIDGPLYVVSPGGAYLTSTNFYVLPTLTGFSPSGGAAGAVVTLQGTGLKNTKSVFFGSVQAQSVTNVDSQTVQVAVPFGIKTAPITIVTANGTNTSSALFYAPPRIDSFAPLSGLPGTSITLNGASFDGATQVTLAGLTLTGLQIINSGQIRVNAPNLIVTGTFQVTTPGGVAVSTSSFSVVGPQPTITGFTPNLGPVGTQVTISGLNLVSATSVSFGGVSAPFAVSGANLIAQVPTGAPTGYIRVTTPSGTVTSATPFTVGTTADLRLTLNPSLKPALSYVPLTLAFEVDNFGPLTSSNLQVTVTYPSSLKYLSASGTPDFDRLGNSVVYRFGPIVAGDNARGTLVLSVGSPTNLVVTAVATSSTPIPSGGANQSTLNFSSVLPALELDPIDPTTLLLQWPSAASTYRLESTAGLRSQVWTLVTNSATDDGFTKQLTIVPTDVGTYYRLHNPSVP